MAMMNPMKTSFCSRAELNHLHAPSLFCGGEESLLKHFSHRMDSSHLSFHPSPPDNFISSYAKWKVFRCSSALYSRETTPSPPLHEEFIFKPGSADMLLLFSFFFLLNSNLKAPICQKKKVFIHQLARTCLVAVAFYCCSANWGMRAESKLGGLHKVKGSRSKNLSTKDRLAPPQNPRTDLGYQQSHWNPTTSFHHIQVEAERVRITSVHKK